MLILTKYIAKKEYKPLNKHLNIDDLLDGAKRVIKGLAVETKPPRDIPNFRFFKVRIGKRNSVRMIVFLVTTNQKIVPVLIRLKKDKIFGMNMAMNNPYVVQQINKNLDRILDDLKNNDYQSFDLA